MVAEQPYRNKKSPRAARVATLPPGFGSKEAYQVKTYEYSLGLALRNCPIKKRGPDLARRRAKKNTEPVRVWAAAEKSSPG